MKVGAGGLVKEPRGSSVSICLLASKMVQRALGPGGGIKVCEVEQEAWFSAELNGKSITRSQGPASDLTWE